MLTQQETGFTWVCIYLFMQVLNGHKTSVRNVSYSNSGKFISSVALDGEVKLWSAVNGSQVLSLVNSLS